MIKTHWIGLLNIFWRVVRETIRGFAGRCTSNPSQMQPLSSSLVSVKLTSWQKETTWLATLGWVGFKNSRPKNSQSLFHFSKKWQSLSWGSFFEPYPFCSCFCEESTLGRSRHLTKWSANRRRIFFNRKSLRGLAAVRWSLSSHKLPFHGFLVDFCCVCIMSSWNSTKLTVLQNPYENKDFSGRMVSGIPDFHCPGLWLCFWDCGNCKALCCGRPCPWRLDYWRSVFLFGNPKQMSLCDRSNPESKKDYIDCAATNFQWRVVKWNMELWNMTLKELVKGWLWVTRNGTAGSLDFFWELSFLLRRESWQGLECQKSMKRWLWVKKGYLKKQLVNGQIDKNCVFFKKLNY